MMMMGKGSKENDIRLDRVLISDLFMITVGSFLITSAFNTLLIPNQLLSGGIGGVAILLHYLSGWNTSLLYVLLNIPIFLFGMNYIGRRFIIYSLVGAIAFSAFLSLTQNFPAVIDDPLLGGILGGLLHGLGAGIVFRGRGSTGGVDVLAVALKKWKGFSLGQTTIAFNLILMVIFGMIFDLKLAVYTLISMFITTWVIDFMESGLEEARTVMIVSAKSRLIAKSIMAKMHRGVTFLTGTGGYTGERQEVVLCVVNPTEVPQLKEIVFAVDEQAFLIINNAKEVVGQGFKLKPFEY